MLKSASLSMGINKHECRVCAGFAVAQCVINSGHICAMIFLITSVQDQIISENITVAEFLD